MRPLNSTHKCVII